MALEFDDLKSWLDKYRQESTPELPTETTDDEFQKMSNQINQIENKSTEPKVEEIEPLNNPTSMSMKTIDQTSQKGAGQYNNQKPIELGGEGLNIGTDEELKSAQSTKTWMDLLANLGKAGAYIGAGLNKSAGAPITQPFDDQLKQNESIVNNLKDRISNQKNDPNSAVSKSMQAYAEKALGYKFKGPQSATSLESQMPYLFRGREAEANRDARGQTERMHREELALRREELRHGKELAAQGKQEKENHDYADKQALNIKASKPYKDLQTAQGKANQIKSAVNNPSAFKDVSAIFAFMKTLDPASVVRESEYSTAANAGGLIDRINNALNKPATGQTLNDSQRKELLSIADEITKFGKDSLDDYTKNVRYTAKKRGIDPKEIFGGDYSEPEEKSQKPSEKASDSKGSNEVERLDKTSGKIAIFDGDTKQFLRWK